MLFIAEKMQPLFYSKMLRKATNSSVLVFVRLCNCEQVIWFLIARHDVTDSGYFYKLFKELRLFKNLTLLEIVKLFIIWNISRDSHYWLSTV